MHRTVIVVEHDGLKTREFSMTFDVPSADFDLIAAAKCAATDYCKTPDGISVFIYNCHSINWADFEMYVPDEFCERHGFKKVSCTLADITVDWDEQLVDENSLSAIIDKEGV